MKEILDEDSFLRKDRVEIMTILCTVTGTW